MKAFVSPGQGAQFVGMGKDLYDNNPIAHDMFEKANEILGFRITDLMFNGTDEDLRQTKVTQLSWPRLLRMKLNQTWPPVIRSVSSPHW